MMHWKYSLIIAKCTCNLYCANVSHVTFIVQNILRGAALDRFFGCDNVIVSLFYKRTRFTTCPTSVSFPQARL